MYVTCSADAGQLHSPLLQALFGQLGICSVAVSEVLTRLLGVPRSSLAVLMPIGAILSVPGIREGLQAARAPVVGVSPIIGARPVRGMADACLGALGVATSAVAVARHYGARGEPGGAGSGLLDGWLVDTADAEEAGALAGEGYAVADLDLLMSDVTEAARIAGAALALAEDLRARR